MTKKGSYFQKHLAQQGENISSRQALPIKPISEEKKAEFEEGRVILIDKPLHWTSFDAVRKIRSAIRIKKVGHAGTLDPLATGLLLVCTGKFTKRIDEFQGMPKSYRATILLGEETPSFDGETEVSKSYDISSISIDDVKKAMATFEGEIDQVPPMYSAIIGTSFFRSCVQHLRPSVS